MNSLILTKEDANDMHADTFLPPIEKPRGTDDEAGVLLYASAIRQSADAAESPHARLPTAFGLFYTKIGKLDKKLTLPPETVLLIREQVARINVCLFCMDIGRSFAIKATMNEAKFNALEGVPHEQPVHRCGTRRAGLCDGADKREES